MMRSAVGEVQKKKGRLEGCGCIHRRKKKKNKKSSTKKKMEIMQPTQNREEVWLRFNEKNSIH
jgi:hypothetical protein